MSSSPHSPAPDDASPDDADRRAVEATVAEPHGVARPAARPDETTIFAGPTPPVPGDAAPGGHGPAAGQPGGDDGEVVALAARYTVLGPLGAGGMGRVLLATDNRLGRKVAIKRINAEASGSHTALARFFGEARAIAALNHPNIVQIYDYGRAVDGPFIVMEYVEGGSLLDRCAAGPIPLAEAIDLACRLCDGLAEAHDQKIIHRDIKPANVLLTRDDVPKLTDFGLAKAGTFDHDRSITSPGAILGTADFMPPEQRRSAGLVDHRSDLWSLAATVYQMVTGRAPRIIRMDDVPPGLRTVLSRALEDDKDKRFQSARQLRDALEAGAPPSGGAPVAAARHCPACNAPNEPGRKFCRGCAGPLEAPCLSCGEPLPVQEEICGACGVRQTPLAEANRDATASLQARAEALLGDCEFDRAIEVAAGLRGPVHPRLDRIDGWVESFLDTVDAARKRHEADAVEAVARATVLFGQARHGEALAILSTLPAAAPEAARLRAEIEQAVERARCLSATIRDAVKAGRLDGLLDDVGAFLELEPAAAEAEKLRRALVARAGKLAAAAALERAGRFAEAAEAFEGMTAFRADVTVTEGRRRCRRAAVERARALAAVKSARPGTRAAAVEEASAYRSMLAAMEATDAEFSADLRRAEAALAEEEAAARQRWRVVIAGGVLAASVAIAATGFGVRSALRGAAAARARRAEAIAALPEAVLIRLPPIVNSIGVELKLLPSGTFMMGDPPGDGDEPPRRVTITKPFLVGATEVTNAQWERVMGRLPSRWTESDRPVENVSWDDAVEFCRRLSALPAERRAGRTYRLPTEAEWEYACRAGTTTAYSFGDAEEALQDHGWFAGNSGTGPHRVAARRENPWGLFDMHGNVWEWCGVRGGGDETEAAGDPRAPSGTLRAYRGGGWSGAAAYCRSASRLTNSPETRFDFLGFRVAVTPSPEVLLEAAQRR